MRIGLDMQAARGEVTGLGRYALGLSAALRTAAGIHCVELGLTGAAHLRTPVRMLREQCLPLRTRRHALDVLHLPAFAPPLWGAARRVCTVHDLNVLDDPQILAPNLSRFTGAPGCHIWRPKPMRSSLPHCIPHRVFNGIFPMPGRACTSLPIHPERIFSPPHRKNAGGCG